MPLIPIKDQSVASFEVLYIENHAWLFGWLRKKMGCHHSAADLAHDTYLRLLIKGRVPAEDDSRRYLTRIAKGLLIDRYRRKKIETSYLEVLQQLPESETPNIETQYIVVETLLEIDRMLHTLPDKVRQVLLMRQLDGMSYKAIAANLSVSVSSVEKYVARGLLACHQALNDD